MNLNEYLTRIGERARTAARALAAADARKRNRALDEIAKALRSRASEILDANAKDVLLAAEIELPAAAIDRLKLDPKRLERMAASVEEVADLPDPVGRILAEWTRPNGLRIEKVAVPIGVIGIIYESRPNVTSDAAVICLKAGNAVILRGGSEAIESNSAISAALEAGCAAAGLPGEAIQFVATTDREAVRLLAQMDRHVDLIIPRGGHALIEAIVSQARMPVIKHFHGVCHVYVDKDADVAMAERIVINAKCQRPGVCNALETLLVHRDIARPFFTRLAPALRQNSVELRADAASLAMLSGLGYPQLFAANEESWTTEYLDLILSVRMVESEEQAIEHISRYGSQHSDAIVTSSPAAAERFLDEVDSATVYWNASTRFTDGGEFGFGAEIGISTDKLHARGPMGLEELTTYRYKIRGTGQVRD